MKMKVMIVEDEPRVREGLSESIDWNEHGMELVGTAENGLDGLEAFRRYRPDLVLADVRMPVMDGLQMAEQIVEEQPETLLIVLTGYDEFEYAQKAIRLGVRNYLLKPIGKRQLLEELQSARDDWREALDRKHDTEAIRRSMERQLPVLRSAFMEDWLNGEGKRTGPIGEKIAFFDLPLDDTGLAAVAVFELDRTESPADDPLLQFAMHNIVSEQLGGCGISHLRGNGQTVVIYQSVTAKDSLKELLLWVERAKREAARYLKVSITVGVGSRVVPLAEVPAVFTEAQQALRLKLSVGAGLVLYEDLVLPPSGHLPLLTDSDQTLIVHCVELNDEAELERVIRQFFDSAKRLDPPHKYPEELFFPFAGLFVSLVHRLGRGVRSVLDEEDYKLFRYPERFRSLDEMGRWWCERFIRISLQFDHYRKARKVKLMEAVMTYVEEHIFDKITREDAAEHIRINSSYLSRLFREVTGEAFSDFVLRKKMEKAMSLLQEEQALVYEVADRLGYKDPSYFSRVFKKYTGRSPSDFA